VTCARDPPPPPPPGWVTQVTPAPKHVTCDGACNIVLRLAGRAGAEVKAAVARVITSQLLADTVVGESRLLLGTLHCRIQSGCLSGGGVSL